MSDKSSFAACCQICCFPCYHCLCPEQQNGNKYPHVQYKTPEMANVSVQSHQIHKVPLEKTFVFRQPRTEYSVHPLTTDISDAEHPDTISEQPRSSKSDSVETYHTSSDGASDENVSIPSPPDSLPTLQFSLYYDIQRNTLAVHLQQAYNLSSKTRGEGCNSCVVLYLLPNKLEVFESRVVRKSLHPAYDQMFHFSSLSGPDLLRKQTLVFRVFEYTRFSSRDMIGVVSVQLGDADLYGMSTKMQIQKASGDNSADSKGDILFSLTYKPDNNTIQGIILRATNLQGTDLTGTIDPYVKVSLYHKRTRQHKWKSTTKKQCLTPVYNEQFQFDIFNMNVDSIFLEFIIMDYDRFSRDDIVGTVRVGPDVTEESCRTHWEEIIASPNHAVSRWHKVVPKGRPRTHTW